MKVHCLRGFVLGVSLALLLAGGAALAQGLTVVADQDCLECWPGPYDSPPPDEYVVELTIEGHEPGEVLCLQLYRDGERVWTSPRCLIAPPAAQLSLPFIVPCDIRPIPVQAMPSLLDAEILQDRTVEEMYGDWKARFWHPATGEAASATWRFAEVCEEEFVPEPGSVILLGGGLAGLAGYAVLRLRSAQAQPWRTGE